MRFIRFLLLGLGLALGIPMQAELPGVVTAKNTVVTGADAAEYDAGSVHSALGLECARFRWWAPEGVKVRGVLVVLPGRGGDARGAVDRPHWRALAEEQQLGIVGCQLKNLASEPFAYQQDPNGMTSGLLNEAINALLAQNGQAMKNPPLCLYGHSAGANVSQRYAGRYPDRVVAAVLLRCPNGAGDLAPGKENVPMLVLVGQKDKPEWVSAARASYDRGNTANALWTMALHPDEGHGEGNTRDLSVTFLSSVAKLRLPPASPFAQTGSTRPKRLSRQQSWLGSPEDFTVAAYNQFKGKKNGATWLPDEATALAWQAYLKK